MIYKLFTTTTCPKCPIFKSTLKSLIKEDIEEINETHPEFQTLISIYNLTSAPTLIILDGENVKLISSDIPEIEDFYKNLKV